MSSVFSRHSMCARLGLTRKRARCREEISKRRLLARCLYRTPLLLIADEPTRGVRRRSAPCHLRDHFGPSAGRGLAVLLVSSETEEVLGLAGRILVMRKGRIVRELPGATPMRSRSCKPHSGSTRVGMSGTAGANIDRSQVPLRLRRPTLRLGSRVRDRRQLCRHLHRIKHRQLDLPDAAQPPERRRPVLASRDHGVRRDDRVHCWGFRSFYRRGVRPRRRNLLPRRRFTGRRRTSPCSWAFSSGW